MNIRWNTVLVFVGLIQVILSLEWKNPATLENNVTIPACPGQDVTLAWDFNKDPGETILDVEWHYHATDGSEEILASQLHGHFFPDPGAAQRLVYLPEAGIRLLHVTAADSGTYSVQVNLNLHGSIVTHDQSVYVDVTEASVTTNGNIQAHFEGAQLMNSTQQHQLILSCGIFNQEWVPKMDVVWTTSRNRTLPSTFQDNTTFYLAVPNSFVSGEYTCKIDKSSPVMVCIESDSPLRRGATVVVDGVEGRIALMDSEMQTLKAKVQAMTATDAQLRSEIDYLTNHSLDLRLVGGSNIYEGRVEAILRGRSDESWGTVCDDNWTTEDAEVVCRQLGLPSASARAWTSGRFGQGSGSIVMDSVNCNGSESSLLDCSFAFGQHNCGHEHDVGVTCGFDVRLGGEQNALAPGGLVEVKMGLSSWGTVCDDGFGAEEAKVVCRHFGLPSDNAVAWRSAFGHGRSPVVMNNLRCTGSETDLLDCSFAFGPNSCSQEHPVGVTCGFDLYLVGGSGLKSGRVEVSRGGVTICDEGFTAANAQVVCRQLGLTRFHVKVWGSASFGQGRGPILMNKFNCTGTEHTLLDCPSTLSQSNCNHQHDVGVTCTADSTIRLVGGSSPNSGRVEIFHGGVWGTVCDDIFDTTVGGAKVVCRQLGLPSNNPTVRTDVAAGSGTIHMDQVNCTGSESRLTGCAFSGFGVNDCTHLEDVGVTCAC